MFLVCCRTKEYSELSVRLRLNAAVEIAPLTPEQMDAYLQTAGESVVALRKALGYDKVLQELADTPLMLNVMTLAYQGISVESLIHNNRTLEERRALFFDTYIDRMFEHRTEIQRMFRGRDVDDKLYKDQTTREQLSWLATSMNKHKKTLFLLEEFQPSWLSSSHISMTYFILSRSFFGYASQPMSLVPSKVLSGVGFLMDG